MATQPTPPAQKGHAGADALRPVRYAGSILKGTAVGIFDGMSRYGSKGLWAGAGLGIFAGIAAGPLIAGGFVGTVVMGAVGGFVLGALGGAAAGALVGGYNRVSRDMRRDKYATEVAERQSARAAREARTQSSGLDYRAIAQQRRNASNYNFERSLQQERENDRDFSTYWQDRMEGQRGHGNGRGF